MARARRLILVRHAEVELRADVPAPEWRLTKAGHAAAARLAHDPAFAGARVVATSPEPKALATAEPIAARLGVPLRVERDLRETERPEPFPLMDAASHRALVARYLRGEALEGWEPQDAVRARVGAVLERLDGDAAVVSHGRALALHLGLSAEEWAALPLPAIVAVV